MCRISVRRSLCAGLAMLGLCPALSRAHTVSVVRGTVIVHCDHIVVEMELSAHDIRDIYDVQASPSADDESAWRDAAVRSGHRLLSDLAIRDADGVRIAGRLAATTLRAGGEAGRERPTHGGVPAGLSAMNDTNVSYTFDYSVDKPPQYLTFQQLPGAGDTMPPSNLVLFVRAAAGGAGRTIQLTQRGNAETLEFAWPVESSVQGGPAYPGAALAPAGPPAYEFAPGAADDDRFRSMRASIDVGDDGLRVDIHLPLVILESWRPVPRAEGDFLTPSEQAAALPGLREFFAGQNLVLINGEPVRPFVQRLVFLGPDDALAEPASPPRRLGAWSARVGVSLSYSVGVAPQNVEIRWTLFNNAILTVPAVVTSRGESREHEFSTYAPTLSWSPGS